MSQAKVTKLSSTKARPNESEPTTEPLQEEARTLLFDSFSLAQATQRRTSRFLICSPAVVIMFPNCRLKT